MSRYYDPVVHRFLNADGYLQAGEDILDVNMFAYCGTNPGNFVPSSRDVETNTGLSFSTVPRPGAAMTSIEELNATGVVYAYQDSLTHITVKPIGGIIAEWRNQGTSSVWTKTIKSLVVKWDGSE